MSEHEVVEMKLSDFIRVNGLTMGAVRIPARTDAVADAWSKDARHWVCTIVRGGGDYQGGLRQPCREFAIQYSQGSAHKAAPTLAEVLDCLRSDAGCGAESFENFCSDCGYDSDSRKAYGVWEACKDSRAKLSALLGPDALRTLTEKCERL
jgi:hypothetical protein